LSKDKGKKSTGARKEAAVEVLNPNFAQNVPQPATGTAVAKTTTPSGTDADDVDLRVCSIVSRDSHLTIRNSLLAKSK
jgi:hypothetical protein